MASTVSPGFRLFAGIVGSVALVLLYVSIVRGGFALLSNGGGRGGPGDVWLMFLLLAPLGLFAPLGWALSFYFPFRDQDAFARLARVGTGLIVAAGLLSLSGFLLFALHVLGRLFPFFLLAAALCAAIALSIGWGRYFGSRRQPW